MEQNLINRLADILEDKVASRHNNRSLAVRIFRDCQCLYNDYRTVKIFNSAINFLIQRFKQGDGIIKLTNTSRNIGDIAVTILNPKDITSNNIVALAMGDLILEVLIEQNILTLNREPYFRVEDIYDKGVKKKANFNPYTLEMGTEFPKITVNPRERIGISLHPYKDWRDGKRITDGVEERLIKSNIEVKSTFKKPAFMKSIKTLENVKWSINPRIAEISLKLKDELINTKITLKDFDRNDVEFDVTDIKREFQNKHLNGIDLYRDDDIFEPHRGNSSAVPTLEYEIERVSSRLKKLKNKVKQEEAKEALHKLHKAYNIENRRWTDKQFCLRIQSQAARNKAIIDTINGVGDTPGWLGYTFYQGMYLDYRGRIYNREPYFSYQSNDLARGHFMFAEERKVDQRGAEYTFIYAASSFNQTYSIDEIKETDWFEHDYVHELEQSGMVDISVDKMSTIDKHNWTIENIEKMLDVGENPLEHKEYWMSAEKPWVFLSLCFEIGGIVGAALTNSPYYSGLPISVDGVNNGTQHLAAMSKDEKAGRLVGLTPMEIPKDFYLKIGKKMLELNEGTPLGKKLQKIPMKLVRKGISKRGSMTRAYDAGARKIGEIIYQDSYDAGITSKYKITKSDAKALGKDLVEAYDEVCCGPVHIKKYLQELVKHRIKSLNIKDVSWTTPSGFPVLTEKWVSRKKRYQGRIGGKSISHIYLDVTETPALAEHLSAIGANWVHSYDASHMSLVINSLGDKYFGAIHDSFSVHASAVEDLIDTTKREFIKMYSKDIFLEMRENLIYNDTVFNVEDPELGNLILEEILESNFFFC